MPETLETLRARMQSWLSANTTRLPDTVANDMINIVQRELCRKHDLRFLETSNTFVTVAGTAAYTLPTNWSRPYRFWYTHPDTTTVVQLENVAKETFDAWYPDATQTALPTVYTIWGPSLFLGKTPASVLTIFREYYALLPDLSDGSPTNTNALLTNAWETLFWGALVQASMFMFEDQRAPSWEAQYRRSESDLVSEHARAWSSGRIPQSQEPG